MSDRLAIFPESQRDFDRFAAMGDAAIPRLQHTDLPIEAVGVAHVVTAVAIDKPGYALSNVVLTTYVEAEPDEHRWMTGSVGLAVAAVSMHEHWCDIERLVRCARGDAAALSVLDIDCSTVGRAIPPPEYRWPATPWLAVFRDLVELATTRCDPKPDPDQLVARYVRRAGSGAGRRPSARRRVSPVT